MSSAHTIQRMGRDTFPLLKNIRDRMICQRLKEHMHMIWHDNKRIENISDAVIFEQNSLNNLPCRWFLKDATPISGIKPPLNTSVKLCPILIGNSLIPWLWM